MFLSLLEEKQKIAFIDLAQRLIGSDRKFSSEEIDLFRVMVAEMDLLKVPSPTNRSIAELAESFDSKKSKCVAAIELISLAYADNELAAGEIKMLKEFLWYLDFSEAEISSMQNWVVRKYALVGEAKQLWEQK